MNKTIASEVQNVSGYVVAKIPGITAMSKDAKQLRMENTTDAMQNLKSSLLMHVITQVNHK